MELWYVIILTVIAVLAVTLLLFFELMGDSPARWRRQPHKRGEYINEQNAVICHTVKDTADPDKAYTIFVEYIFTNYKLFLSYLKDTFAKISKSYFAKDTESLKRIVRDIKEMKIELKDQKQSQTDCLNSIDPVTYIESLAWFNLANSCLFEVNDGLMHIANACIEYIENYTEPFPELYADELNVLASDICNTSKEIYDLVGTNDIEDMREMRKTMSIILSESYANSQRLYELLHDGRSELDPEKRIALQYALNAFQESHCMLYTLRRLVLAIICISLSIR